MTSQALSDRYGAPAPWRRRVLIGVVVVVAAVFLGWLAWTAWSHSTPEVESELIGFDVVDEHTAIADVQVEIHDEDADVSCLLRATAADKATVGELAFAPEDGGGRQQETIRTDRRATSVMLVGCTTPDQSRPR